MKKFGKKKVPNELTNLKVQTKRSEKIKKEKVNKKWVCTIVLISFTLSILLSFISELTIPKFNLFIGIVICLMFIFIGILFDIVGVSVTAADPKVFHSMNSRKVSGANIAVKFIKNKDKVSSFCCDVVGDICGVISGSASVTIALLIATNLNMNLLIISLITTGLVSSLTIGGKAIGKSFAINKSNIILYEFAKIISIFYKCK